MPPMTPAIARRLVSSEADYMVSLLTGTRARFGDVSGIHIRRFGQAFAFANLTDPNPLYNRVLGLASEEEDQLPEIIPWYANLGCVPRFEIVPYHVNERLLRQLAHAGFSQCHFMSVLYGVAPQNTPPTFPEITVRRIGPEELALFAEMFCEVYEVVPEAHAAVYENVEAQYAQDGWHCYVAEMNGIAAAIGALFVKDGVGSLVSGLTRPAYRNRGCQTALLHYRIREAARLGCDLVTSVTEVGTTSQHNMERAGLRLAYTKSEWIPLI